MLTIRSSYDVTAVPENKRNSHPIEGNEYCKRTEECDVQASSPRDKSFVWRRREKASRNKDGPRMATAKIYLWKGLGQTNDRVGQVFFNFVTPKADKKDIFSEGLRSRIRFVCMIIRELIIEQDFHKDLSPVSFSPENVLGQLNNVFSLSRESGYNDHGRLDLKQAWLRRFAA
jgi:hypothetical protein